MKRGLGLLFALALLWSEWPVAGQEPCVPAEPEPVFVRLARPTVVFLWPPHPVTQVEPVAREELQKELAELNRDRRAREQWKRLRGQLESRGVVVLRVAAGATRLLAFTQDGFTQSYDLRRLAGKRAILFFCPGSPLRIVTEPISDAEVLDSVARCVVTPAERKEAAEQRAAADEARWF